MAHTASPAGATHWLVAAAAAGDAVHVVGFVCYLDVALQLPDGATLSTGEDANTRPAPVRQRRIKAKDEVLMQGITYLVAAYALVWVGLLAYLGVVMLRIRGVRTELAAVRELVREQQEKNS